MPRDVVKAKLDVIFKKLFTEHNDLLVDFISEILEIPAEKIQNIVVTNPELPPETISGKFSRLDLKLQTDEQLINLEIQIQNHSNFRDRTLFYWSKLYTLELKEGDEYSDLKKAIAVNIINFNMFDKKTYPNYHTEIQTVIKETGEVFSDKFSIHFFELKKVGNKIDPSNRKALWLQFINAESEEEFEMIRNTDVPVMKKAVRVIYDMSEDARIREMAWIREKAMFDEASALGDARREGKAEGRAEGREEGREEGRAEERSRIVENLRKMGMTEEQIKQILNF